MQAHATPRQKPSSHHVTHPNHRPPYTTKPQVRHDKGQKSQTRKQNQKNKKIHHTHPKSHACISLNRSRAPTLTRTHARTHAHKPQIQNQPPRLTPNPGKTASAYRRTEFVRVFRSATGWFGVAWGYVGSAFVCSCCVGCFVSVCLW